jgi:hypothetical protein
MGILNFFRKQVVGGHSPYVLELQDEIALAKNIIAELNIKINTAAADLEKTKELAAKEESEADAKELELKQLMQQLDTLKKIELDNKVSLDLKSKEFYELQSTAEKLKQEVDNANTNTAASATQLDVLNNKFIELQTQYETTIRESKSLQSQMHALSKEPVELKNIIETQKAEIVKLKAELESALRKNLEDKEKQDDAEQENELLLLQLMQAQEELVEYYEKKERFEKLYEIFKTRWDRLEKRHPNYIDFGEIELVAFDHASNVPSLTWRVRDYAYGGQALPEFLFQIALQNEHPGIGLVTETNAVAKEDSTLVPKLLAQRLQQTDYFLAMSATEQRQLSAALSILAQLEANQWRGLEVPEELDLSFWKPSITQLIAQWKLLPVSLRFDQVKLKRELINADYEHLWLELHGASYGKQSWKKLEVRLGAALVQPDGFSQFPKFEIPLIDGKHKPFESWFAESYDDAGAKFELRFSLEKGVFDTAALAKLSEIDRSLVLRLVYGMPAALQKLQKQGVSIHRDWKTWQGFALQATQALERSRKAANAGSEQQNNSTVNKIKPKIIYDTVTDQQIRPTAQGDVSKALANGKANQAKLIRVSAEAAQKKMSPAKKTSAPLSISIKNIKSDGDTKDKSAVVKAPNKRMEKILSAKPSGALPSDK